MKSEERGGSINVLIKNPQKPWPELIVTNHICYGRLNPVHVIFMHTFLPQRSILTQVVPQRGNILTQVIPQRGNMLTQVIPQRDDVKCSRVEPSHKHG